MSAILRTGARINTVDEEGEVTIFCYSLSRSFSFRVASSEAKVWGARLGTLITMLVLDEEYDADLHECAECSAKPGAPTLCRACLEKRARAGSAWRGQRQSSGAGDGRCDRPEGPQTGTYTTPARGPEEAGTDATQVAGSTPAASSGSRERGESSGSVGFGEDWSPPSVGARVQRKGYGARTAGKVKHYVAECCWPYIVWDDGKESVVAPWMLQVVDEEHSSEGLRCLQCDRALDDRLHVVFYGLHFCDVACASCPTADRAISEARRTRQSPTQVTSNSERRK